MSLENFGDKVNTNGFDKRPQDTTKGGAPKGKRASTILNELLSKKATTLSNKEAYKDLDGNTAMMLELIGMAFNSDNTDRDKLSAIKEILDRTEGKAVQTIQETKAPQFNFFDARKKPIVSNQ